MRFLSTKTEHRRKWEEGLPERDKVLRLQIQVLKSGIKRDKKAMKYAFDEGDKAFLKRSVNAQNVVIRAIKHEIHQVELVRPVYLGEGCYACNFCHDLLVDGFLDEKPSLQFCPQCGHTIKWGAETYENKN